MAEQHSSVTEAAGRKGRRFRALKPLLFWLVASVALVAWQGYRQLAARTTVTFSIFVDGKPTSDDCSAKLDGHPFASGNRTRVGKRDLTIEGLDIEPFQKKVSVWFGGNDLGQINLIRSKGTLEIKLDPKPKQTIVSGRLFQTTNTEADVRLTVPVGEYRVSAAFEHMTEEKTVSVRRNETSRLDIKPPVGTLELTSEPSDAAFRLSAAQVGGLNLDGKTAALLRELPAGQYHLRAWRGHYSKDSSIEIKGHQTNQQHVVFEYADVKLNTKPEGVTVFDGSKEIGKTPLHINDLKPGQYQFQLRLDGYYPVDVAVTATGKQSFIISTNLINVRYTEAMNAVRSFVGANLEDYGKALVRIEEALQAQPGDAEATAFKVKLEAALKEQETKLGEERSRTEAEAKLVARRQLAVENFKKLDQTIQNGNLFELHVWNVKADFAKVREALLRYAAKGTEKWAPTNEYQIDPKLSIFRFDPKGLLAEKKFGFVQLCGVSDGETEIRCKICLYAKEVPLGGGQLTPVHEQSYQPGFPQLARQWREKVTQRFKQSFEQEVGSEFK